MEREYGRRPGRSICETSYLTYGEPFSAGEFDPYPGSKRGNFMNPGAPGPPARQSQVGNQRWLFQSSSGIGIAVR
jgi:hypothetical protein